MLKAQIAELEQIRREQTEEIESYAQQAKTAAGRAHNAEIVADNAIVANEDMATVCSRLHSLAYRVAPSAAGAGQTWQDAFAAAERGRREAEDLVEQLRARAPEGEAG